MTLEVSSTQPDDLVTLIHKRAAFLKEGYRQNIAVVGPRLIGKTARIFRALRELNDPRIIPVYLEIKCEPLQDVLERLAGAALHGYLQAEHCAPAGELEPLIQQVAARLPKTAAVLQQAFQYLKHHQRGMAFSHMLEFLRVFQQESQRSCIVVLDEFQELDRLGLEHPFQVLGKHIMVERGIMYILVSSQSAQAKEILQEKLNLLFGRFELVELGSLQLGAVEQLLGRAWEGWGEQPWLRTAASLTDGNPVTLELLRQAIDTAHLRRPDEPLRAVLVGALQALLTPSTGLLHLHWLQRLECHQPARLGAAQIAVLRAIAYGGRRTDDVARACRVSQPEAGRLIARLAELELIRRCGNCCVIEETLFHWWLRDIYFGQGGCWTPYLSDLYQRQLRQRLETLILERARAMSRPTGERLQALFGQFRDDLLPVDNQRRRLAQFSQIEWRNGKPQEYLLIAHDRGQAWLCWISQRPVTERDVTEFAAFCRRWPHKPKQRLLLALGGMELNARLCAKAAKMWLWEQPQVEGLLKVYGHAPLGS